MPDKRFCIGEITTAHGIKGAVKLRVFAENIDLFKVPVFTSDTGSDALVIKLEKDCGTFWLARVDGVMDRTQAEKLRGTKLYCDRAHLPAPDDGEYYLDDLIGLAVRDASGEAMGKVIAVENFGAEDLLEIKPTTGKSFYLPLRTSLVPEVNIDAGFLVITADPEWTAP